MSNNATPTESSFLILMDLLEEPNGFSLSKLKAAAEDLHIKDKKCWIDVALRGRMLRLLACDSLDDVKTLLKVGVAAALANLCSAPTPFLLFADVFNTKPISVCQELFNFMEETIITLKDVPLFGSGRNTLLRMCNDLLRRLSKSQNTVFCGQIQLFLTRLFPLDEKSGLNFMSNFNVEKDIIYNKNPDPTIFKHQLSAEVVSDDLEEGEMTESAAPFEVDASLYVKFWLLQEFFKSPTLCYEKSKWVRFVNSTDTTLEIFSSIKLVNSEENYIYSQSSGKKFSKYLTSEKLLDLQLMDPTFRRYILVQLLLIFQYLTTSTKFKTPEQILTEEQRNWVASRQEMVLNLLSSGSVDSRSITPFVSAVERILERETHWNRWKNDGCPSFVRNVEKPILSPRKRRLNPLVNRTGQKIYRFGNRELDKLWNVCPDNLIACRDDRRLFRADLQSYFQNAIIELDPSEKVEEEYKSINKDEWSWRALRFLARRCPYFYINWNPPGRPIKDYLSIILTEKIQLEEDKKQNTITNIDSNSSENIPSKLARMDENGELINSTPTRPGVGHHSNTSRTVVSEESSGNKRQINTRSGTRSARTGREVSIESSNRDTETNRLLDHTSATDEELDTVNGSNS